MSRLRLAVLALAAAVLPDTYNVYCYGCYRWTH
jgi:hypothetical protein